MEIENTFSLPAMHGSYDSQFHKSAEEGAGSTSLALSFRTFSKANVITSFFANIENPSAETAVYEVVFGAWGKWATLLRRKGQAVAVSEMEGLDLAEPAISGTDDGDMDLPPPPAPVLITYWVVLNADGSLAAGRGPSIGEGTLLTVPAIKEIGDSINPLSNTKALFSCGEQRVEILEPMLNFWEGNVAAAAGGVHMMYEASLEAAAAAGQGGAGATAALEAEQEKARQRAERFGVEVQHDQRNIFAWTEYKKMMKLRQRERRRAAAPQGIVAGIDLTSTEEQEKAQKRRERFGVVEPEPRPAAAAAAATAGWTGGGGGALARPLGAGRPGRGGAAGGNSKGDAEGFRLYTDGGAGGGGGGPEDDPGEAERRAAARAARFGVAPKPVWQLLRVRRKRLYAPDPLRADPPPAGGGGGGGGGRPAPDKVHLHALDAAFKQIRSADLLAHFGAWGAFYVEWLTDVSCNVCLPSEEAAAKLLADLGADLPPPEGTPAPTPAAAAAAPAAPAAPAAAAAAPAAAAAAPSAENTEMEGVEADPKEQTSEKNNEANSTGKQVVDLIGLGWRLGKRRLEKIKNDRFGKKGTSVAYLLRPALASDVLLERPPPKGPLKKPKRKRGGGGGGGGAGSLLGLGVAGGGGGGGGEGGQGEEEDDGGLDHFTRLLRRAAGQRRPANGAGGGAKGGEGAAAAAAGPGGRAAAAAAKEEEEEEEEEGEEGSGGAGSGAAAPPPLKRLQMHGDGSFTTKRNSMPMSSSGTLFGRRTIPYMDVQSALLDGNGEPTQTKFEKGIMQQGPGLPISSTPNNNINTTTAMVAEEEEGEEVEEGEEK